MSEDSTAGAMILEARILADISQAEQAQRAGTSPAAIAMYETGKRQPQFDTLERIIEAAGFDLRCIVAPPDEQDRQYRQWAATLPDGVIDDFNTAMSNRAAGLREKNAKANRRFGIR